MTADERKRQFIEALGRTQGNISRACEESGIPRRTVNNWRKSDPQFSEQCEGIISMFSDARELKKNEPKPRRSAEIYYEDEAEAEFASYSGRPAREIFEEEAEMLRNAMRELGTYSAAYEPMIRNVARQCAQLVMAFDESDRYAVFQTEYTAGGTPKLVCNPIYANVTKMAEVQGRLLSRLGLSFDPKRENEGEDARDILNKL